MSALAPFSSCLHCVPAVSAVTPEGDGDLQIPARRTCFRRASASTRRRPSPGNPAGRAAIDAPGRLSERELSSGRRPRRPSVIQCLWGAGTAPAAARQQTCQTARLLARRAQPATALDTPAVCEASEARVSRRVVRRSAWWGVLWGATEWRVAAGRRQTGRRTAARCRSAPSVVELCWSGGAGSAAPSGARAAPSSRVCMSDGMVPSGSWLLA